MHIPTVVKLLGKAGITPVQLAVELSNASIEAGTAVIKTLNLNDDAYSFKIDGSFAQCIVLYVSDDDGNNWHVIDSFSDH